LWDHLCRSGHGVIAVSLCFEYYLWKSRNNTGVPPTVHSVPQVFLFLIIDVFYSG
jgi:hypothetical protein